ncbi:MAG: translation initiation factor IF-2, partial [Alphaproteobacteria bacterium]
AAEEARRRTEEEKAAEAERERQARDAKRQAEEEAQRRAQEQARLGKDERERKKPAPDARLGVAGTEEGESEDSGRRRDQKAKRKNEAVKPTRREDERRRSGKLSVNMALGDEEGMRQRSLASLRRAREKEKRAHQAAIAGPKKAREVVLPEAITVQELANRMAEKSSDVIKTLMKMGVMATINQTLDQDTAELVVGEFGHTVKRVSEADVEIGLIGAEDAAEDMEPRPPVVTVMGHVDHGKTSLLDAIRQADVAAGEAGGITQHIGAYQVRLPSGNKVTFLDTPGHEAFTAMRARGASVTDIVVLVVAADDGIMPQTVEAINHARAAKVPLIVAINKIDKAGANPDKVRQELLQHEVIVESLSGETLDVEVSAVTRANIDKLLEAIVLQAELLELGANPNRAAEGVVIESQLDKGRGPVATVLIKRGTLRVGDIFVTGPEWGKVRALIDDRGEPIDAAGPSQPVEVLGLSGTPAAGDDFAVVESEARAREIASYRQDVLKRNRQVMAPASLESMFSRLKEGQAQEYPVVVKGDVQGSVEAITAALEKLSTDEIKVRVLHAAVGGVNESDVVLAKASDAAIIGF